MNYPERGGTVYQDIMYVLMFICTNIFILAAFIGLVFVVMLIYGYKSITIKFNKRNKFLKQVERQNKRKEKSYISKLEKKTKR